jgi:hypothetical protein
VSGEATDDQTASEQQPLTCDQKTQLNDDIKAIENLLDPMIVLIRAACGLGSPPVIRAEEIYGAVQRLKWELERLVLR